jgi:hypothetical protein
MPTTRARRLISLLTRSSGLVDHTLGQWLRGKAVKASASVFASSISGPIFGKAAASWSRTLSQVAATGGVGLGEDRPEYGDHVLVGLGHQRQHVTGEVHPAWSYRAPERLPLALLAPRSAGGAGRTLGATDEGPQHRPCRVERRCAVCWRQVE